MTRDHGKKEIHDYVIRYKNKPLIDPNSYMIYIHQSKNLTCNLEIVVVVVQLLQSFLEWLVDEHGVHVASASPGYDYTR